MLMLVAVHQPSPDGLALLAGLAFDLSSTDSTQAHCVDAEHQPTDLAVGGSNPSRRATTGHPTGLRASDLPAAVPHTASQHPISVPSIRPATCSSIERSEVPRCPPNGPTIDGKDGVAGSIPAGGSTPNQQLRPGPAPGLLHVRSASNRHLPEICQKTRSVVVRTRSAAPGLAGPPPPAQRRQQQPPGDPGWP
jgi:hypothetical protein